MSQETLTDESWTEDSYYDETSSDETSSDETSSDETSSNPLNMIDNYNYAFETYLDKFHESKENTLSSICLYISKILPSDANGAWVFVKLVDVQLIQVLKYFNEVISNNDLDIKQGIFYCEYILKQMKEVCEDTNAIVDLLNQVQVLLSEIPNNSTLLITDENFKEDIEIYHTIAKSYKQSIQTLQDKNKAILDLHRLQYITELKFSIVLILSFVSYTLSDCRDINKLIVLHNTVQYFLNNIILQAISIK